MHSYLICVGLYPVFQRGIPICRATVVVGPGPAASDRSNKSHYDQRGIKQQQLESLKALWREMGSWDNNCSLQFGEAEHRYRRSWGCMDRVG